MMSPVSKILPDSEHRLKSADQKITGLLFGDGFDRGNRRWAVFASVVGRRYQATP